MNTEAKVTKFTNSYGVDVTKDGALFASTFTKTYAEAIQFAADAMSLLMRSTPPVHREVGGQS